MIQQNIFQPYGCYRDIAKKISEGLRETVKPFSMGLITSLLPTPLLMIEFKNLWELGSGSNQEPGMLKCSHYSGKIGRNSNLFIHGRYFLPQNYSRTTE